MSSAFIVGQPYTRAQIAEAIGLPTEKHRGGNWATGYDKWNGEYFVFCNIGIAGRSGHDYANRWDGKTLFWLAKNGTRLGQPVIEEMIAGSAPVHVFWRAQDRAAFTYAGMAAATDVYDQSPVAVVWAFETSVQGAAEASPAPAEGQADPSFRRGPRPSPGLRTVNIPDGRTSLYLMELTGNSKSILSTLKDGHRVIKVGISNSPARRLAELNQGYPPGSQVGWRIVDQRSYATGLDAFSQEGACLELLRTEGHWIGGEFAVVPPEVLDRLRKRWWLD